MAPRYLYIGAVFRDRFLRAAAPRLSAVAGKSSLFRVVFSLILLLSIGLTQGSAVDYPYSSYLPVVSDQAFDFSIDSIEVTQSVQTPTNSVPLVSNRGTIARVYARLSMANPRPAPSSIYVTLSATRGGTALTTLTAGPLSISTNPSRAYLDSSVNFTLPADWKSGGTISITAKVDSSSAINEINETNNTATTSVTFNTVPGLNITIVPIAYKDKYSNQYYAAPTTDTISDWIRRAYPISQVTVTIHPTLDLKQFGYPNSYFEGSLQSHLTDWGDLLHLVDTLKLSIDGARSSTVYYGFVSGGTPSNTWTGSSFYPGIGLTGSRTSAGVDMSAWGSDRSGQIAAHQIGHNLGRQNAPCGNPSNPDPKYPYNAGSIGQYGLDIAMMQLWNPNPNSATNPYGASDVMSECKPVWLSDYTYQGLYTDQVQNGAKSPSANSPAAQAAPGVLVRATLAGSQGTTEIKPLYALGNTTLSPSEAPPAEAANGTRSLQVEFLDAAGAVVASSPVTAYPVETPFLTDVEGNGQPGNSSNEPAFWLVDALVQRPNASFSTVRLSQDGHVLAERPAASSLSSIGTPSAEGSLSAAQASLSTADGQLTLRWAEKEPALVRYHSGSGWLLLGLDVTSGELAVDPASLPGGAGSFEISLDGGSMPIMIQR